jgi:hypothetical protein
VLIEPWRQTTTSDAPLIDFKLNIDGMRLKISEVYVHTGNRFPRDPKREVLLSGFEITLTSDKQYSKQAQIALDMNYDINCLEITEDGVSVPPYIGELFAHILEVNIPAGCTDLNDAKIKKLEQTDVPAHLGDHRIVERSTSKTPKINRLYSVPSPTFLRRNRIMSMISELEKDVSTAREKKLLQILKELV